MKKIFFLAFFLMTQFLAKAQQEAEFFKLEYITSGSSKIMDSPYETMNEIATTNSVINANLNFGHEIKKDTVSLFYALSYSHFSQNIDISDVADRETLENIPSAYYQYPNFSQISLASGIDFKLNKKWGATILGGISFTDDFFKTELQSNLTWLSMAYLERKKNENFSYGFGVFINQLENKLLFTPSATLKYQNEKMGFEVLFPEKIRFWHKVKQNNFIDASLNAKVLSVAYADDNLVRGLDIYTIKGDIGYNFIWHKIFKLKIGLDFPLILNSVSTTNENFEFIQYNSIGLNMSLSLIIPNE